MNSKIIALTFKGLCRRWREVVRVVAVVMISFMFVTGVLLYSGNMKKWLNKYARFSVRCIELMNLLHIHMSSVSTPKVMRKMGITCCPNTCINHLKKIQRLPDRTARNIGIDDFAKRKRHTYGSVIVDHDTGEILELIDSRDSSIVANVLKQYKKVNTITRDRGRCFIKAIKQGAPSAHAITDKFGAIFRPIEDSPLRIGLAVHTPTYYKLTYTTGALLTSDLFLPNEAGDETLTRTTVDTYSALGGRDMDRDFKLQTPWVFNASLGYTVGNNLALGAEYEYEDYSSMKFKYPEGDEMAWETGEADLCMKGVSTLRLGAEYKPIPAFSLRAGYNYSTAAYKKDAIKALPSNSINTDTDFANSKSMNTFTLGIGYRFSSFYADLAYKFDTYKSDFYPFYNDINGLVTPPTTEVTNTRSKVLFTLGMRF